MTERALVQDVRRIASGPLALEFTWRDDRWIHSLLLESPFSRERLVAHFIDRGSPATPVFQDLAVQESEGGAIALLVGLRGRLHDSASFTAKANGQGATIAADFAVRAGKPTTEEDHDPACVYAVDLPIVDLVEAGESRLTWVCREPEGLLTIEAGAGSVQLSAAEAGRRATMVCATARFEGRNSRFMFSFHWTSANILEKDRTP
jgi:hypothetical protein